MKIDQCVLDALSLAIENQGADKILALLEDSSRTVLDRTLTIISNQNAHFIPERFLRGEIFIASRGNMDFSSLDVITRQYDEIMLSLRQKLMQKSWAKIYLIPTGHPTLSLQIKSTVYRVTRLDTVDLFYSNGEYFDIELNWRNSVKIREEI